ncbi:MAG: glycosyltransferase family 2 protein [Bryobacteraceae bacterium]|nr:glycosyltransferase family 2 protein [Bryobacteraceae bacterium]
MHCTVASVVIPTLAADSALRDCLRSLEAQTFQDFDIVVVDNSGRGAVRQLGIPSARVRIIENSSNAGFGTAVNQGWQSSESPWIATLNDDAEAEPAWLEKMIAAAKQDPEIGLVACQVRLSESELDSAGMLISSDGSSKQRGHGQLPSAFPREEEILMPTGSAALYRREMLEDIGGFADAFFLYCEDTDLGLRAARRGWRCRYVPTAIVRHSYSRTAGRASALKALLVERNRLYLIIRNFPLRMLWKAPFASTLRYVWHVLYMFRGRGKAAEFAKAGGNGAALPMLVLKAHWQAMKHAATLLQERREIRSRTYLSDVQFERLMAKYSISVREVAAL